ncbi:hydantoinase/oxoprolinase family protein [Microvirga antarctica]|uniref:hydantoinase/oxoprolinase family protein n=1 Tax=Microvirga antarctica TaxID=2819233 RepID=UPI001B30599F|nr:hydantoinase/oxoprolinase family protein [Microvirga antarctica]
MASRYRLGFDVGGTFTDFMLVDQETGTTFLNKCLTTPDDPSRGVMDGLLPLLDRAGVGGDDVDIAIHATTLITNALIERKGARTALLTTQGFRDVLEMGTEVRYDIYDLFLQKPELLVPRSRRYEVTERLDKDGKVLTALDEDGVRAVAQQLREDGAQALAIVFLHAFRNAAHELRAAEIIAEELPDLTVSISSAVAPEIREYERMSTTTANAYVQPITRAYIDTIQRRLREMGYPRNLYLMISSGGIAGGQTAKDFPIRMLESGPTAGVLAGIHYGRQMGIGSLVTFDMGGTTAKIALVKNYEAAKSNVFEVGRVARFKKGSGLPVKVPMVELIEIGAGGGSIAHVDQLGLLKVGPLSAGADPGPACYGRGGSLPTVTDANLVLGYYDPNFFLGGAMSLDVEAARKALETQLGGVLGLSAEQCARGIYEVVTQNMLAATKVHIAERGEDPRKFFLFAFGGAGPAHAYELARLLHMRGVIVPAGAGATSAAGLVTAAVSFDYARSLLGRLDRLPWEEVRRVFDAMAEEGLQVLEGAGVARDAPGVVVKHQMDLRHKGQGHEVTVTVPADVIADGQIDRIAEIFYATHREKYGHAHENLPLELVTCRTTVGAAAPEIPMKRLPEATETADVAQKGTRPAYFGELGRFVETPVYDRYALRPGMLLRGPAIVEERECTVVAGPSAGLRIDAFGNLFIDLDEAPIAESKEARNVETERA